jgi:predicted permease
MSFLTWIRKLWPSIAPRSAGDVEEELRSTLDAYQDDLVRQGLPEDEARRKAWMDFGKPAAQNETYRDAIGLRLFDELVGDIRYGLRALRRDPAFAGVAVLSLALAIGANTTIFSVAKEVIYDHLNVPHPDQLRLLKWVGDQNAAVHGLWGNWEVRPDGGRAGREFTYPVYQHLKEESRSLENLFAFKNREMNATIRGNAKRVQAEMVSGNYFAALNVRTQLGRAIQPSDTAVIGAGTVAVISDGLWERDFARSPAVLGQTITLNQVALTIVGVAPRGFTGAINPQFSPDVFAPLSLQPVISPLFGEASSLLVSPDVWWVEIMGRIKPGVSDKDAQATLDAQMQAALRGTMQINSGETLPHLKLTDGSHGINFAAGALSKPINVLMALTGFVLLLACANIANLLLARGAHRRREMGVRMAVGARRGRILRQMLTESLLLATLGGLAGLLVGNLGRKAIPSLLFKAWDTDRYSVPLDWGVFAFAAGVTLLTGLIFGLAPAWSAARTDVGSNLKESAQTATRRRKGVSGKSIVAFQIALSTLLVVGAGLFLRTLLALDSVDVGFRTDHFLLFGLELPEKRYPVGKQSQLYVRVEQAIAALPGVEAVTAVTTPYIANATSTLNFVIEGEKYDSELQDEVDNNFFATMGIPIVAGRGFGPQDKATSPKVAVINQSLAHKKFPHENPIGKRFTTDWPPKGDWIQVVGICADTHYDTLRDAPPAQFIVPYIQDRRIPFMTFEVRTHSLPSSVEPSIRQVVQRIDPNLPVLDFRTQQEQIKGAMQMERVFAELTSGFGLLALALACVGVYGIMAYSVAQRTNEIGIRLALGAQPTQVHRMVLRESAWLSLAGVVVGVAAALGLANFVKSMLYGIKPWDPETLAGGAAVLLAVALAAAWVPARRAANVQPVEALRHE